MDIKNSVNLEEKISWLNSIVDTTVDGIITIDKKGIVQTFNKACENIFGYKSYEVIGNNVNILMPEPYHSEHNNYLKNYHKTGQAKIIGIGRQVEGKRKDNSVFPMDLSVAKVETGNKTFYSGIVRDITDRIKNEQIKNEFISIVSHELRTPLTSIHGSLGLILGSDIEKLPKDIIKLLNIAYKNSNHLIMLVKDILDIDKIAAGKMTFHLSIEQVDKLIYDAIKSNKVYSDAFNIKIDLLKIDPDLKILIDIDRFRQVFFNLFSNAVKFSNKDSKIKIYVSDTKEKIKINIQDYGRGIPESFFHNMFKKFSQADASDTRSKNGTGLGLYITKELVERMNGKIGFKTKIEQGTTFWIEFKKANTL